MSKFDELSPAQSEMIEVLAYEYYSYPEEEIAGVTGYSRAGAKRFSVTL